MMTLLNLMLAGKVGALVDEAIGPVRYPNPAMSEAQAIAIIHAVLWLAGVRSHSTSAVYAWGEYYQATVGLDWFEWRAQRLALGLNPDVEWAPSAAEARRMRVALGLRHNLWRDG